MGAVAIEAADLPPLSEVIEDIGFGFAQVKAQLLGGGVWFADGAELLLIGSVTRSLASEWHLDATARSSIVAVVFCGVLCGNVISGWVGDSSGRWLAIVLSYLAVALFSVFSALSQHVVMLGTVRFFVGTAFGMGQPAWNALLSELTPAGFRMEMQGASQCLFTLGECYAALLIWSDDPSMKHLDWRRLLILGAIPSMILAALSMVYLQESPSFLAIVGRPELAKQQLLDMRRDNGNEHISVDFKTTDVVQGKRECGASLIVQLGIVFGRRMIVSTLVICFSCFSLNFVLYGGIYALPQALPNVNMGMSPAAALFFSALWEIPGVVLALFMSCMMDRKPAVSLTLMFACASLVLFAWAGDQPEHAPGVHLALGVGLAGLKSMTMSVFTLVYQLAGEIFPTSARSTGSAMCIASGRIGAVLCPLVYEMLYEKTGGFSTFFYLMGGICMLNATAIRFIPETKGMRLSDTEGDMLAITT